MKRTENKHKRKLSNMEHQESGSAAEKDAVSSEHMSTNTTNTTTCGLIWTVCTKPH